MSNLQRDIPQETPLRRTLLNRAGVLITGQRQQDYGSPEENFQRIADFWNTHLKKKLKDGEEISPRQVAEMMMLLKLARTINSPTEDSYVDAAGYAGIAGELADTELKIQVATQIKVIAEETTENKPHECGPGC